MDECVLSYHFMHSFSMVLRERQQKQHPGISLKVGKNCQNEFTKKISHQEAAPGESPFWGSKSLP